MNTPSHRFEILDHTADVGLRVFGDSLGELFESAAFGLLSTIVEDLPALAPTASAPVALRRVRERSDRSSPSCPVDRRFLQRRLQLRRRLSSNFRR